MSSYWITRVLQTIPLLIGVSIIVFIILRLTPGDPSTLLADPSFLTKQQQIELRQSLGLDDPWPTQYVKTMTGIATGQLHSFRTGQSTTEMIADALPTTFSVALVGILEAIAISLILGIAAARNPGGVIDRILSVSIAAAVAFPSFVLALFLIRIFAENWQILPASGIRPLGATGYDPITMLPYLVLPGVVTAFPLAAILARYTRDAVREVLAEDYVRTARSKGLAESIVLWRHVLRNALIPIVSVVGSVMPFLLGGSVIVESVFGLPGIGRITVQAALQRDYPVVMTTTLLAGVLVILSNLVTDIVYGIVDPRIRPR